MDVIGWDWFISRCSTESNLSLRPNIRLSDNKVYPCASEGRSKRFYIKKSNFVKVNCLVLFLKRILLWFRNKFTIYIQYYPTYQKQLQKFWKINKFKGICCFSVINWIIYWKLSYGLLYTLHLTSELGYSTRNLNYIDVYFGEVHNKRKLYSVGELISLFRYLSSKLFISTNLRFIRLWTCRQKITLDMGYWRRVLRT